MSGPGGPPGAGGRGSYSGARLRSASGPAPGPASPRRLTPLPPGSRPAPARVAASLAARLGPSSSGTPRSRDPPPLPVSSSPAPFLLPGSRRLPLRPPPLPAAGAGASRERRGVRNPFPPPPPLRLSGAVRGWRAAVSAGGGGGGETRRRTSERAERGHTAALRPTGEEQPRRSPPREGGWAAAWGGVSRPPQWLPRSQVDLRPRPGAATSAAPPPRALQDAAAPARTPEPTGAGASPAPLREVSPGPGGRRSLGPRGPPRLSRPRGLRRKAGAGPPYPRPCERPGEPRPPRVKPSPLSRARKAKQGRSGPGQRGRN